MLCVGTFRCFSLFFHPRRAPARLELCVSVRPEGGCFPRAARNPMLVHTTHKNDLVTRNPRISRVRSLNIYVHVFFSDVPAPALVLRKFAEPAFRTRGSEGFAPGSGPRPGTRPPATTRHHAGSRASHVIFHAIAIPPSGSQTHTAAAGFRGFDRV